MTATLNRATDPGFEESTHQIAVRRATVLADLTAALTTLELAAGAVDRLRTQPPIDSDLADGRDGRDIAAHLDDAIRCGRAAYAVLRAATAHDEEDQP